MKKFLIITLSFLAGAIVATIVVWYLLLSASSQSTAGPSMAPVMSTPTSSQEVRVDDVIDSGTATSAPALPTLTKPMTIDLTVLSDTQRAILRTLGIEGDTLTVTPEMQQCAETKLGAERLAAIVAGDTPSLTEGAALIGCLR